MKTYEAHGDFVVETDDAGRSRILAECIRTDARGEEDAEFIAEALKVYSELVREGRV